MSKNTLSHLIRFPTVKLEIARHWAAQPAYPFQGFLDATIASDFEFSSGSDPLFDIVAFFEFQGFDYSGRKPNGQCFPILILA